MASILIKVIGAFLLFSTWGVSFATETIKLAVGEYTPYIAKDLKHHGLASHIVTEAFALVGYDAELIFSSQRRAYEDGKSRYDGTFLWFRNPQREADFFFSDPIIEETQYFFHLKSFKISWHTLDDLKGMDVGGINGFYYGPEYKQYVDDKKIAVDLAVEDVHNFRKLLAGRIQLFPQELRVGYDAIRKYFSPEEAALFTHHPKPLYTNFSYLLLSRSDPDNRRIMEEFNKGLRLLRESGRYEQFVKAFEQGEYLEQ